MMPTAIACAVIHIVHKFPFVYVLTPTFESGGQAWELYARSASSSGSVSHNAH
jgi:hypothetical protein